MSRRMLQQFGVIGSIVNDTILDVGDESLAEKTIALSESHEPGGFAAHVHQALLQLELSTRLVGLVGPDDCGLSPITAGRVPLSCLTCRP